MDNPSFFLAPMSLNGFKSISNSTLLDEEPVMCAPKDYYQPAEMGHLCLPPSSIDGLSMSQQTNSKKVSRKHYGSEVRASPYKPTVPYAQLITLAIESRHDKKITLNEIYNYAMEQYEYFKTAGSGWKVKFDLS
jgi:Forkhead domain